MGSDAGSDIAADIKPDAQLEVEGKEEDTKADPVVQKAEIPKIPFRCECCGFVAVCNYRGTAPPFAKNIKFDEACYVMQDPFSPPPGNATSKSNSEYFIVIGADCCLCARIVCAATACSLFYQKSYCCDCAYQTIATFPLEIQSKIRKIISNRH